MSENLSDLLSFAHELAWQAGKITLRYFQTGITPDLKADESPVTVADRETEQYLRDAIAKRFPTHAVLGEEYGETGAGASHRWIVDPIDGTRSFVRGVPLYGVMIGLERDGEPVLGVVNIPALGEIVTGAKGLGARWNGRPCRVSQTSSLKESLLLSSAVSQYDDPRNLPALQRLIESVGTFRTWGDCYGYMMVATGRAEVMVDPQMSIWDAAALLPIMQEAGGTFTDWKGNATITAGEGIGSNGHILPELLKIINN
jgi:histidinol-phosphatase